MGEVYKTIRDIFKQMFCKHRWFQYNRIQSVKEIGYVERWLICTKCSKHKWITTWKKR